LENKTGGKHSFSSCFILGVGEGKGKRKREKEKEEGKGGRKWEREMREGGDDVRYDTISSMLLRVSYSYNKII
jgi:hypothetical protein